VGVFGPRRQFPTSRLPSCNLVEGKGQVYVWGFMGGEGQLWHAFVSMFCNEAKGIVVGVHVAVELYGSRGLMRL